MQAATGQPISRWQADTRPTLPPGSWRAAVLEPARPALYARCDARLEQILREGALDEVRALMARGLDPALPVMKAVGVRELGACVTGETSLKDAVVLAQQETRRYAKRQSTWLRNQTPDWPRLRTTDEVEAFVEGVEAGPA